MERRKRERKRGMRGRMSGLAWTFIAMPLIFLVVGRSGSVYELAFGPIVGGLMLLWQWRHPVPAEHVASVENVRGEFYLAWCDCGWNGDDQTSEASARWEAQQHTEHVLPGLHAWDE
jgi:hypothetical protein